MLFNDRRNVKRSPFGRGESYQVSENVTVKSPTNKPFAPKSLEGARQALHQNIDAMPVKSNESESKANARGLKAANSKTMFKVNRPMTRLLVGKGGGTLIGRDVNVKRGSKKEAKLKSRLKDYEEK